MSYAAGRRRLSTSSAPSRMQKVMESFFEPAHKVVLSVPATTSNLGPAFDSLGLALNFRNRLTVERAERFSIDVRGEGAALDDSGWSPLGITHDQGNLMVRSCKKVLDIFGGAKGEERTMGLRFECHNAVPAQRGLGSSSSALVLGMAAGLALCGRELYTPTSKKLLLQLAADEEGHADNIAAAIYGGMQVNFRASSTGRHGAGQWITQRVRLPRGLHCVLFIPDEKHVLRDAARATLPENYSRTDAVHNLGRTAMLVSSFASGQFDALRFAMEDRIHQPYRRVLFPFEFLIDAALAAGAHGAFLSSQGPTVVAICGSSTGPEIGSDTMAQFLAEAVSVAMTTEAERRGFSGETHIATPTEEGLLTEGFASDGTPLWGAAWEEAQKAQMWQTAPNSPTSPK